MNKYLLIACISLGLCVWFLDAQLTRKTEQSVPQAVFFGPQQNATPVDGNYQSIDGVISRID